MIAQEVVIDEGLLHLAEEEGSDYRVEEFGVSLR